MMQYLVPPDGKPASIAPSLQRIKHGVGTNGTISNGTNGANGVNGVNGGHSAHENGATPYDTEPEPDNPTVVPAEMLAKFHFTFLIRDPHSSIPSYYRCTIPPLDKLTGFYNFDPLEAGYDEVRRLFDYLRKTGQVGPRHADDTGNGTHGNDTNGATNGYYSANANKGGVEICVIDADDLLDDPEGILTKFCKSVNFKFEPEMLNWDNQQNQTLAKKTFEKWPGFHEDVINSKDLKPRSHVSC
jgi:Sulfotransferase domain